MKRQRLFPVFTAALVALGCFAPAARADVIAYVVPDKVLGQTTFGNQTNVATHIGQEFDVVRPVTITQLGVYDSGQNGLIAPLTATLWNRDSGQKMAELTFDAGSPGTLIGGSRFLPLTTGGGPLEMPVDLPAGFHGVISVSAFAPSGYTYNAGAPFDTIYDQTYNPYYNPAVNFLGARAGYTEDGAGALLLTGVSQTGANLRWVYSESASQMPATIGQNLTGDTPAIPFAATFKYSTDALALGPGTVPISVQNASFEHDPNGREVPTAWAQQGYVYVESDPGGGATFTPTDGINALDVFPNRNEDGSGFLTDASVTQAVGGLLQSNTHYELMVDVGLRNDRNPANAAYKVELLANGEPIATENSMSLVTGQFVTSTIDFDTLTNDPLAGQQLGIRLTAPGLNAQGTNNVSILFDNVRLFATAGPAGVPEPSTMALGLLAMAALAGLAWRRRNSA